MVSVRNVGMDRVYKVREGEREAKLWEVKRFDLPGGEIARE